MSEPYIRPLCLYEETCLHKKEKTKKCSECWHYENYWIEVTLRDLEKNLIITRKQLQRCKQVIEEIKEIAESNIDDNQIIAMQVILNGSPDIKNEVLAKIIQKCEEINDQKIL